MMGIPCNEGAILLPPNVAKILVRIDLAGVPTSINIVLLYCILQIKIYIFVRLSVNMLC